MTLTDEHAVFVGVSGVLNDGDDVSPLLGDVDEVTAGAMRELHCIHQPILHRGTVAETERVAGYLSVNCTLI